MDIGSLTVTTRTCSWGDISLKSLCISGTSLVRLTRSSTRKSQALPCFSGVETQGIPGQCLSGFLPANQPDDQSGRHQAEQPVHGNDVRDPPTLPPRKRALSSVRRSR